MDTMQVKNGILAALAAVGSFIANQLGGWDTALIVLICMMAADYVTGIVVAGVFHNSKKSCTGKIDSKVSFKGLILKMMILVVVWVGTMLDKVIGAEYIRTAITLFFIANEGISILENMGLMGVPFPKFLQAALEAMKDKNDNASE